MPAASIPGAEGAAGRGVGLLCKGLGCVKGAGERPGVEMGVLEDCIGLGDGWLVLPRFCVAGVVDGTGTGEPGAVPEGVDRPGLLGGTSDLMGAGVDVGETTATVGDVAGEVVLNVPTGKPGQYPQYSWQYALQQICICQLWYPATASQLKHYNKVFSKNASHALIASLPQVVSYRSLRRASVLNIARLLVTYC